MLISLRATVILSTDDRLSESRLEKKKSLGMLNLSEVRALMSEDRTLSIACSLEMRHRWKQFNAGETNETLENCIVTYRLNRGTHI